MTQAPQQPPQPQPQPQPRPDEPEPEEEEGERYSGGPIPRESPSGTPPEERSN